MTDAQKWRALVAAYVEGYLDMQPPQSAAEIFATEDGYELHPAAKRLRDAVRMEYRRRLAALKRKKGAANEHSIPNPRTTDRAT